MSYLLFFIYLILFCWLLTKINFISNSGIEKKLVIILFLARIAAGLINGYVNLYYYTGTDIAYFNQYGITEYHLLFNHPHEYFTNLFKDNRSYTAFLDMTHSYWNNLRSNLIIKLLSIFDIFSFGNFFINTIFYNFLVFFGSVSFYKIFITIFPSAKKLLIISLFLLPSVIYFSSGVHREGLIFLGLGISCYGFLKIIKSEKRSLKALLLFSSGLIIIFLIRNFVFITLIPAFIAWMIAEKNKKFTLPVFLITYLLFTLIFFNLGLINSRLYLPQYVSERQIAFIQLTKESNSAININPLFSTARSFFNNAPQALNHTLMRPYLTEKFTALSIPASIEIFMYEVLFLLFLFFRTKNNISSPFIYFGIFFSLSMFLMIGYTIPIIGALVRYRSIYFPFLIIPLVCNTDWEKIKKFLMYKKIK